MTPSRIFLYSAAVLGLGAACSEPGEPAASGAGIDEAAVTESAAPAPDPASAVPGEVPAIDMAALAPGDMDGQLEGELRCVFTDGDARPLMAAAANVGNAEPIMALVKTDGALQTLSARTGGYDRMVDGASYAGEGLVVEIVVEGADIAGGEGFAFPATLTVVRAGGDETSWDGLWTCGP